MKLPAWAAFAGDPEAWEIAQRDYREGDPSKLAELVGAYLADPAGVARFVGPPNTGAITLAHDALAGKAKTDGRRRNARKVKPGVMEWALLELGCLRAHRDGWKGERLEAWADKEGVEVAEALARIDAEYRQRVVEIAVRAGVSVETIEQAARPSRRGRSKPV